MVNALLIQPRAFSANGMHAMVGPNVIKRNNCDAGYFCWFNKRNIKGGPSAGAGLETIRIVPATTKSSVANNPMRKQSVPLRSDSRRRIVPKP